MGVVVREFASSCMSNHFDVRNGTLNHKHVCSANCPDIDENGYSACARKMASNVRPCCFELTPPFEPLSTLRSGSLIFLARRCPAVLVFRSIWDRYGHKEHD